MTRPITETTSPILGLSDVMFARLRCPESDCGGALRSESVSPHGEDEIRHGFLACRRCHEHYPVLMGVPILMPSPQAYVATHQEAILATLAEFGEADAVPVTLVQELANLGPRVRPAPFDDDWVKEEASRHWPLPPATAAFAGHAFTAFLAEAERHRPEKVLSEWMSAMVPKRAKFVVDVGCGVGTIGAALMAHAQEVLVADFSLRAVCTAQRTARAAGFENPSGVVCDAGALPLRPRCADAVVGAHLLDVMENPGAFLQCARDVVRKRGVVLVSTPDPTLGTGQDVLAEVLENSDLAIRKRDTVPWIRPHNGRHFEVYFSEVIAARPVGG